jgi:hypothetical protein
LEEQSDKKEASMPMIKLAELFKKRDADGKVFYVSRRIGDAFIMLIQNEEKQQLLDPDLLLYVSPSDSLLKEGKDPDEF